MKSLLEKLKQDENEGDYVIYKPVDMENEDGTQSSVMMLGNYEDAEILVGGTVTPDEEGKKYLEELVESGRFTQEEADQIWEENTK